MVETVLNNVARFSEASDTKLGQAVSEILHLASLRFSGSEFLGIFQYVEVSLRSFAVLKL